MSAVADHVAKLAQDELRLGFDDEDGDRIARKAAVAVEQIVAYVDRVEPWPDAVDAWPAAVLDAAVTVTQELYRRKDAPFGLLAERNVDGERTRISSDPLAGVRALLAPYRQRWGIA